MKALRVCSIAAGILSLAFIGQAQNVDDIINKHIDAIGGKDKISGIKSIYTEGQMEVMGNDAPMTTYMVNGKGYKSEMDFNGSKIVQCITPTFGWQINPMMGQSAPDTIPAEQMRGSKAQIEAGGPLFNYSAKGNKVELQGTEDLNGVKDYKIKLTTPDSLVVLFYIDPNTYYITKEVTQTTAQGQPVETTIALSDYKKTDYGYVAPMSTQLTLPQGITLSITQKKIEVNKDIDPKIFDMPKQ